MRPLFPMLLAGCLPLALIGCNSDSKTEAPANPAPEVRTPTSVKLSFLGRYASGTFLQSAAEITAFDPQTRRGFVVNAQAGTLDVLDMQNPASPSLIQRVSTEDVAPGSVVNSVALHGNLIALAIEPATKTDPGYVALYRNTDLAKVAQVQVGALPDMLTFTPDGRFVLVANEGEPSDDYSIDPEGSISLINIADLANLQVRTANFSAFNTQAAALRSRGVRLFGPGASVAQDLEPEYIAVSEDSQTAWAVLQENNAVARIDIASATVTNILPLGYKDHGLSSTPFGTSNALDASDRDDGNLIRPWPGVYGMHLPDAIAAYTAAGTTYLVTANEGDARAWGEANPAYWAGDASQGFVEEWRVNHLTHKSGFDRRAGEDLPPQLRALAAGALLNPDVFGHCGAVAGDPGSCRSDAQLGRLNVTWTQGYRQDANGVPVMFNATGEQDPNGDRLMYDRLYAFGGRSFSIWSADGELVWDSGDQIEQFLASDSCMLGAARTIPCKDYFNSNHEEGDTRDNRSDNKGPEPEGLALGKLGNKTYAFIGLERMGGVLVYDITDPRAPVRVDYLNTRENWVDEPADNPVAAGDLGVEGIAFVAPDQSPTGEALLILGNEVSGTTAVYQIDQLFGE